MPPISALSSSFRDPAGFVYQENNLFYRAITQQGQSDYDAFMQSGLYQNLADEGKLVRHTERDPEAVPDDLYKILIPEQLPIITYPYEWSFSQLKDAALLTLEIQSEALEVGLSLKDASSYNIQFVDNKPLLIDTLSFEQFKERPWFAYRQFCETFLAPLCFMAYVKPDFNKYLRIDLGGFDLKWCSASLPWHSWVKWGLLMHIHMHAISQKKFEGARSGQVNVQKFKVSKFRALALVDSLRSLVKGLTLKKSQTAFGNYYAEADHYSDGAESKKRELVESWVQQQPVSLALDLGGNNGKFSRLLTKQGISCICADSDVYCIDENYLKSRANNDSLMTPLYLDLTNPSGDIGWNTEERSSFFKRTKADLVMALAIIHHLRISSGISMAFIAKFFANIAPSLIIEFVPKGDPMVQILLQNRDDIFFDYDEESFERAFGEYYEINQRESIPQTKRSLYFLKQKNA